MTHRPRAADVRGIATLHTAFWITTSGSQLTLLPLLASQNLGMSPAGLGGLFGLMALINVIGSQPAAYISDKVWEVLFCGTKQWFMY